MINCDVYLFCLWHQAKPWWKMFMNKLKLSYDVRMIFRSWFPKDISLVRKFYGNENLICGYQRKTEGMAGDFMFAICKDENMNDRKKLTSLKNQFRSIRNIKVDYNLIHGSENLHEFLRQLEIIGRLPWQSVTYM